VIGVVVGVAAGPLCTYALDFLRARRTRNIDRIRRVRLKKILMVPNRIWRELSYLSRAVGATKQRTQQLLLEIDARQSLNRRSTKWALVSRAPFPDDIESERDGDEAEQSN
jgi:macrodomain Ter protein organizer (MatP/YcbG family)